MFFETPKKNPYTGDMYRTMEVLYADKALSSGFDDLKERIKASIPAVYITNITTYRVPVKSLEKIFIKAKHKMYVVIWVGKTKQILHVYRALSIELHDQGVHFVYIKTMESMVEKKDKYDFDALFRKPKFEITPALVALTSFEDQDIDTLSATSNEWIKTQNTLTRKYGIISLGAVNSDDANQPLCDTYRRSGIYRVFPIGLGDKSDRLHPVLSRKQLKDLHLPHQYKTLEEAVEAVIENIPHAVEVLHSALEISRFAQQAEPDNALPVLFFTENEKVSAIIRAVSVALPGRNVAFAAAVKIDKESKVQYGIPPKQKTSLVCFVTDKSSVPDQPESEKKTFLISYDKRQAGTYNYFKIIRSISSKQQKEPFVFMWSNGKCQAYSIWALHRMESLVMFFETPKKNPYTGDMYRTMEVLYADKALSSGFDDLKERIKASIPAVYITNITTYRVPVKSLEKIFIKAKHKMYVVIWVGKTKQILHVYRALSIELHDQGVHFVYIKTMESMVEKKDKYDFDALFRKPKFEITPALVALTSFEDQDIDTLSATSNEWIKTQNTLTRKYGIISLGAVNSDDANQPLCDTYRRSGIYRVFPIGLGDKSDRLHPVLSRKQLKDLHLPHQYKTLEEAVEAVIENIPHAVEVLHSALEISRFAQQAEPDNALPVLFFTENEKVSAIIRAVSVALPGRNVAFAAAVKIDKESKVQYGIPPKQKTSLVCFVTDKSSVPDQPEDLQLLQDYPIYLQQAAKGAVCVYVVER
ncbi:unnamed protein product [Albugo candida]|nr:unnamed protein product [Albugo candida]|eukprot:CCI48167.1 unnamed protein product [Albugo candida]